MTKLNYGSIQITMTTSERKTTTKKGRVDAAAAYILPCGTRRPAVRATYARSPRLRLAKEANAVSRLISGKRRSPKLYLILFYY